MSGSRRSPWASPAIPLPNAASGGGSSSSVNGNAAYAAAANNVVTATRVLGPATTVSATAAPITPAVSGKLSISAFMSAIDATPGQSVAFSLLSGVTTIASIVAIADASGNATASFPNVITTGNAVGTPVTFSISATAAANLTTTALKDQISVIELPA
jgi:hypothetical protein